MKQNDGVTKGIRFFSLVMALFFFFFLLGCEEAEPPKPIPQVPQPSESAQRREKVSYVGADVCAACHKGAYQAWRDSHHAASMQPANAQTVLGNFRDTVFSHKGQVSQFYAADQKFKVRTVGPDGHPHEYEMAYTFGIKPLQQYLIPFAKGRFQALSIAWDTRSEQEGGQRWFHLYPDDTIDPTDELHWTGPNQNWNYMCADCHSTNLQKRYDITRDNYATTWTNINVACEACHGPGSSHVNWARASGSEKESGPYEAKGLSLQFPAFQQEAWQRSPSADTAARQNGMPSSPEIDTCARCHSRRTTIAEGFQPGQPFLDHYIPALLEERLYHADGQIEEEVYVYGSFLQSKMFQKGVTCHDCHEPHGLKLRATGNALCTRCHRSETFDSSAHHFHLSQSNGAQCVGCHMPSKNYMVVDPRRDHSLRIPRPDLSVKLGTPNACTQCHQKRTARWAADQVGKWYGKRERHGVHYGEVLNTGRKGEPGADVSLTKLALESSKPGIVRATALSLLGRYPGPPTLEAIARGLHDEDPLVRIGALRALEVIAPDNRYALARHLLTDKVRAVRIETGRRLAAVPVDSLTNSDRKALSAAVEEYLEAQWVISERPEAHLNRGLVYVDRGQFPQAEEAYRLALKQDAAFFPALVNLADLYRLQKRDQEGEATLRKALTLAPENANVLHALGLSLVRTGNKDDALGMLEQAAKFGPENPRNGYVYAVALSSAGKNQQALSVLEKTRQRHPNDQHLLFMLATLHRDEGNRTKALQFAEKLLALAPNDPGAHHQLLESLQSR
jgi:predicted CXXCH cytochrome family protein